MSAKYLYLYIILGTVFLLISIYELITQYPKFTSGTFYDVIVACVLFYWAYKVYKNKKDQELM